MDISFIYINDYKNIKQQSFNLDAEYIFSFSPETHTVSYKKNPKYIPGYFSSLQQNNISQIKNVTAIIGQNGSGKSNFLEFIGMMFRGWHNFGPAFSFVKDLAVVRSGEQVRIFYGQNYSDHVIKDSSGSFTHNPFSFEPISTASHNFPKTPQNNQTLKEYILPIYYSTSMLDHFHDTGVDQWDVMNISNAYMYYATSLPTQQNTVLKNQYRRLKHPGNFKLEDTLRQITFLSKNKRQKYLSQIFRPFNYFFISVRQQYSQENTFKEIFLLLFKKFKPNDDVEFLRLQFITAVIHGLVFPSDRHKPPVSEASYFKDLLAKVEENNDLQALIISFLKDHPYKDKKEMFEFLGKTIPMYDFRLKQKQKFVNYIFKSFCNKNFKDPHNGALANFTRNLGKRLISIQNMYFNPYDYYFRLDKGEKLCQLYIDQLEELTPDFIEVQFDLSAGEAAFINLFSRFLHGFTQLKAQRIRSNRETIKQHFNSVLVMIDEGEIYFHPQWQKQYLALLTQYFTKLFEGIPVQIIIASNSPFVTADLPSYNVVFLKPNSDRKCIVSSIEQHKDTLGANIYQLFQNAFYLQNGFMGEMAKNKIQEVIEMLNLSKHEFLSIPDSKKKYILQLINNIGEPALKQKLTDMFNELNDNQ